MKNQDKKEISLTKDQYLTLAKTVYLGNWVANAQRSGALNDPHIKEYEEIARYIFSLASEFGFPKTFEHDLECSEDHAETTEVSRIYEEYDKGVFWDELCEMLGERDFFRKYLKEERMRMTEEEHFLKLEECIIAYEEETEEHGIERLEILRQSKDSG